MRRARRLKRAVARWMAFDPRRGAWLRLSQRQQPLDQSAAGRFEEGTGVSLHFDATVSQPAYAKLFLASGGAINTAAAEGPIDFAVTGSTAAVHDTLHNDECRTVTIELPDTMFRVADGRIVLDACSKLNASSLRTGAAINGTLVDTHAGAGSVYLANLLRAGDATGHAQLPCVYGTLASHACTIGISNVRITDASGEEVDVEFVADDTKHTLLAKAETVVDEWARSAWGVREKVVYGLSPNLTKSVAKVPVGINDKGYELVHNIVDQEFPFSIQTLDSLFEHAVGMELEYNADETQQMLSATAYPGMKAAVWAQTIAAACSTAVNYLVAYRADGRTVMRATGSGFEATESWLRTPMRTPCESNDCDGSGLLVLSMIQAAVDAPDEDLDRHPYVRAIKNAVFPYYTYGIAVVAATSAEASGGGSKTQDTVAGHAVAMMIPTTAFLSAIDRAAANHRVEGQSLEAPPESLRKARFRAVFNDDVLDSLPEAEVAKLRAGEFQSFALPPYAMEGTTPAYPVLYTEDAKKRDAHASDSEKDTKALQQAAPNVGRSFKRLDVGGKHKHDPHRFYHDFVEITVHPRHPLYSNSDVRRLSSAATQFVFARPDSTTLCKAGCTPRQLVTNDYVLVPLHTVDLARGEILDFAASVSKQDVIPPRAGAMVLSASQSRDLKRSVAALRGLDARLNKEEVPGHCVAYILAYSSLVNNPQAIEHFCERVASVAVAGLLDFRRVAGLAVHPGEGAKEAGDFVIVNAVMKV